MAKGKSRVTRWQEACDKVREGLDQLLELQSEYSEWFDNLPESLQESPVGEKLETVKDLDLEGIQSTLDEVESTDLPQGFGRD